MKSRGAATLFDLDGTLSDNRAGIIGSIRHALTGMGIAHPDEAALLRCVGPPLRESFATMLATDDRVRIEAAIALYRERYATLGWQENELYGGIGAMLDVLAARSPRLIVCTSKPQVFARRIIDHFGLQRYFTAVYGTDLAGTLDDKRALLKHLLVEEKLDPTLCTMIGDRHHDIRAGIANDTRTIGVLWGFGDRAELADAHAWAAMPAELPELLAHSSA